MDDTLEESPQAGAQAHPRCGAFTYLQLMIGRWQEGQEYDGVTLHEIFHVFGFVHSDDEERLGRGDGVPMSVSLTRARAPDAGAVLWSDIELLRCIFPEGGL